MEVVKQSISERLPNTAQQLVTTHIDLCSEGLAALLEKGFRACSLNFEYQYRYCFLTWFAGFLEVIHKLTRNCCKIYDLGEQASRLEYRKFQFKWCLYDGRQIYNMS